MPELVKEHLSFDFRAAERDESVPPSTKEHYLFLALTSLVAVNLVVIFGALTFYYLLIER